jgi:hypothetical protein
MPETMKELRPDDEVVVKSFPWQVVIRLAQERHERELEAQKEAREEFETAEAAEEATA